MSELPPQALPQDASLLPSIFTGTGYRLWLHGEALVHHEVSAFTESFRRFAVRDIQALVVSRTSRQGTLLAWQFSGAAFGVLPAAFLYNQASLAAALVLLAVFWAFFGCLILVNILRGPTCALDLYTAVQVQRLHACRRLRTADRLLARLLPEIQAHQTVHNSVQGDTTVAEDPPPESAPARDMTEDPANAATTQKEPYA